ncbi:MAG: polyprenyl synthetase family protein [Actinomycetota bacterium]|nr:polyprenyl synthetase family protein [Actinomycetota bacterium]
MPAEEVNKEEVNDINSSELYPSFLVKEINCNIKYYADKYRESPPVLREAMKYTLTCGGKRFRPVLCLLTAKSLGKDYRMVIPTACAIEFIHTYSLIHDDLPSIDNDDFRRGKPSCHRKFGEDIAILTGDALLTEAFNIVLKYQVADDRLKIKVLNEISDASGASGMVAGQVADVYYTGKRIDKNKLEYIHRNKTGKLITASVRCGAILCGADESYLRKFTEYSENIGFAFQIIDDILDVDSDKKITRGERGNYSKKKKNTFPDMLGMEKSRKVAEEKINNAITAIKSMDIDYEWLIKIAKFLLTRKA